MADGQDSPFAPPRIDDPQPHLTRPSVGDVALLSLVQIGLTVLATTTTWLAFRRPMAVVSFAGILVGALIFGLLNRRASRTWTSTYQRALAFWGTVVWGSASATLLILIKYVYAPRARLPGYLLLIGFAFLCLFYSAATLFGLWICSRKSGS